MSIKTDLENSKVLLSQVRNELLSARKTCIDNDYQSNAKSILDIFGEIQVIESDIDSILDEYA